MAKADSIINALEKYFIGCELLKDGALMVDYLGEKPVEYTIEVLPCDPVVKRYLGGILQPGTPAEHPEQRIL